MIHIISPHAGRKVCDDELPKEDEHCVSDYSGNHPLSNPEITSQVTCPKCKKVIDHFIAYCDRMKNELPM